MIRKDSSVKTMLGGLLAVRGHQALLPGPFTCPNPGSYRTRGVAPGYSVSVVRSDAKARPVTGLGC